MESERARSRAQQIARALEEALRYQGVAVELQIAVSRWIEESTASTDLRPQLIDRLDDLIEMLDRWTNEHSSAALLSVLLTELGRARLGMFDCLWDEGKSLAQCRAFAVEEAATYFPRQPRLRVAAKGLIVELERSGGDDLCEFSTDLVVDELHVVLGAEGGHLVRELLRLFPAVPGPSGRA